MQSHVPSNFIAEPQQRKKVTILQRFWIGTLLLELGAIGLTMSAAPKYDTGVMSISVGALLSMTMIFSLAFYGLHRWEVAKLARMPVEISDTMSSLGGPHYRYVFANPEDVLSRVVDAESGPFLARLALVTTIAYFALMVRHRGAPLPLALVIVAVSLFVLWRLYPTLEKIVAKIERVKGVKLVVAQPPLVEPPIHFAAPV